MENLDPEGTSDCSGVQNVAAAVAKVGCDSVEMLEWSDSRLESSQCATDVEEQDAVHSTDAVVVEMHHPMVLASTAPHVFRPDEACCEANQKCPVAISLRPKNYS